MGASVRLNPSAEVERAERIAGIRERGLAAAQANYDPQRHLVGRPSASAGGARTYRPPESLPLAQIMLERGDAASVRQAAAIVEAVLETQELSPQHPHRGNWLWLAGDAEVADLNAVQFVLRALLPLLVQYGDRLPAVLLERCRQAVRLSLVEEERMDVAPTYTNIHIMSLLALLVGGEWLGDEHYIAVGKERWARWVRLTLQAGAPHEYNSPNYGGVDLSALAALIQLLHDPAVRLQARLIYERLWLHLALHVHRPTGQVAGPHCRCYWGPMMSGRGPLKDLIWRETGWDCLLQTGPYGGDVSPPTSLELALVEHEMPSFVVPWLEQQRDLMPYEVREIADAEDGYDLTTYCTPTYALGTASRTYGIGTECYYIEHQANYLSLYYTRPPEAGGWGLMYSRYVVNDRHWGTLAAAPDRPKTFNFYDGGHFAGVQLENKAIGLYALMREQEEVHSLKTVVAFQSGPDLEQVWINDQPVSAEHRTGDLHEGDWLIVVDGGVYVGVRPLKPSCLGREAPLRLERGPLGELWLSIYNYHGPPKRFWDYASLGGAFWQGNLRAGFVVEVAQRADYASASGFLKHLREATVEDEVDADRMRTVTYHSAGDELVLRYDLWKTEPGERSLNGTSYQPPNLHSSFAVQGNSGELVVGSARLHTNPQQVWLVAQEFEAERPCWVAVNPEDVVTPLRLETPLGQITADGWGMGRIEWRVEKGGKQVVVVDGLRRPDGLRVPEGVQVRWRGPHI
jgi:hypothetical protein